MLSNLKEKTLGGLSWSFIDSFSNAVIQFIVGVFLARMLTPREFGLIGMLTIFIAISQSISDSGLSRSLIRKIDCDELDYNTVFFFNFFLGLIFYVVLFFTSNYISIFFNEPQLKDLLRVLAFGVIFNSLAIIQRTILTKKVNFKIQAKASLLSSFLSGVIAISLALQNFGVWSLVFLTVSRFGFMTIFLWIFNSWRPSFIFSKYKLYYHFNFGSKLMISGLIDTIYNNVFHIIIGKYYSPSQLGLYTRAEQFQALPSQNLSGMISKVSYPILSELQNSNYDLLIAFKKMLKITMFVTFILMFGMIAISKSMILVLIGEKWIDMLRILQLLCFVGVFYPIHALNLNILQVKGKSGLYLRLEIFKKIFAIPLFFICVYMGIEELIIAMIIYSFFSFYMNSFYTGKFLNYNFFQQLKDILPSFFLALSMSFFVFLLNYITSISYLQLLFLQIVFGVFLVFLFGELFKNNDYLYLKKIFIDYIFQKK